MNETTRTLLERRSIRKFKAEQIKEDELNAILVAGMYAPSGANQQSALFVYRPLNVPGIQEPRGVPNLESCVQLARR